MYLIFDTETTGLPKNYNAPLSDSDNWPRLVQLSWQIHDKTGKLIEIKNFIVKPENFDIPYNAEKVHGISTQKALLEGSDITFVLSEFSKSLSSCEFVCGHNIEFDINIVGAEFLRKNLNNPLTEIKFICTKEESTNFCAIPGGKGGKFKWPNLSELYFKLFGTTFEDAHNAAYDVAATARCFLELIRLGVIPHHNIKLSNPEYEQFLKTNPNTFQEIQIQAESFKKTNIKTIEQSSPSSNQEETNNHDINFSHLHVHTEYSILDGAAKIPLLIKKAKNDGMKAIAITDHGNMFGAKIFHKTAKKEGIKPIIGCETYIARRSRFDKENKSDGGGYHLILLAKNKEGYQNLTKIISYSWLEGYYYKPRADKDLLKKYANGLIATSACLGGEVAQKIMNEGKEEAEKAILEYKEIFGDDFYLEIQRHPSEDEELNKKVYNDQIYVNKIIVELAEKLNVKFIATNDVHFVNKEDAGAHDRLICIETGRFLDDQTRMKYTQQEWFKTQQEMKTLFADLPNALATTNEIAEKIELYSLDSSPIMPDFKLPDNFTNEDEYLEYITYEGAKLRWAEITEEIKERIDFELATIKKMGFPGYFLIVWDFLKAAREMGVSVGPGRGSAAGSAVAYCLRITEIDPIKYHLLFERFLNPDRISMPDIDIDFDDDGRSKVLEWVVNKYGATRVAHIITFGTMAAKSAIRDVARVQRLPLSESDRLAKLVPEKPGITLEKAFNEVPELLNEKNSKVPEIASVLANAETLEGIVRNTGIHACGIIIGKEDLENYIPISTAKDSELTYVTQFDGKHVEDVGLLKMDFLGLKTLSIIKEAIEIIKLSKGIEIDIDNIPLDDTKTYELYSNGETTGLFQFESDGMKKYLKELKPSKFEDLIAMNALYRPGPMDYIPDFIDRKHGKKPIEYDFPIMEEILKETYGITVYQEQVMLLSRVMAGFTRGEADSLRKAMGKKIQAMMDELKPKFIEGCKRHHNLDEKGVVKVWEDWEKFASYAFNKSHATCYSYISYQTAYLKAHYPAEFMAAVLSRNLNDIKKISFFMDECKSMGIELLGPDVNESHYKFTVNNNGAIRFGLGAIKGVGENAVISIIEERGKNGYYNDIFDFAKRINLRSVNKRCFEALAYSGAFDTLGNQHRAQYFESGSDGIAFIDKIIRHSNQVQQSEANAQATLFGDAETIEITSPQFPEAEKWSSMQLLRNEKDYIGFYISGHPLDEYKIDIDLYCNMNLSQFKDLNKYENQEFKIAGLITGVQHRLTKNNKPFGSFTLEDYDASYNFMLWSEDYLKFKSHLQNDLFVFIKGKINKLPYGQNERIEPKINSIELLSELRDKMVKSITISLPLTEIDNTTTQILQEALCQHTGNSSVKINIIDPESKVCLEMISTKYKINPCNDFLNKINKIKNLFYRLH